jgi:hypothetical protein
MNLQNKQIEAATFAIESNGRKGRCVLIEGGLIVTAAHVIGWDSDTMATMTERCLFKIKTSGGTVSANLLVIEPISDVAVLGCPDRQTYSRESDIYDDLCERVQPVKLLARIPKPGVLFPVWIYECPGSWMAGEAQYCGDGSTFGVHVEGKLVPGMSGGPIVSDAGELVGVVSQGTERCSAAFLPMALPQWILTIARLD